MYDKELFGYKLGKINVSFCENICTNYVDMNYKLQDLTQQQILQCIEYERKNRRRANILNRLYTRFNSLRKNQERLELLK